MPISRVEANFIRGISRACDGRRRAVKVFRCGAVAEQGCKAWDNHRRQSKNGAPAVYNAYLRSETVAPYGKAGLWRIEGAFLTPYGKKIPEAD